MDLACIHWNIINVPMNCFHPKEMGELLVAEFEGKPLAALLVFAKWKTRLVSLWRIDR